MSYSLLIIQSCVAFLLVISSIVFFSVLVLHCSVWDIWVALPSEAQQPQEQRYPFLCQRVQYFPVSKQWWLCLGVWPALPIPVSACSIFLCPNNDDCVWEFDQRYPFLCVQYFPVSKQWWLCLGVWPALPIPVSACSIFLCPNNDDCVWEFECARTFMYAIAHRGCTDTVRVCTGSWLRKKSLCTPGTRTCVWEKNPFPHQGLKSERKIPFHTRNQTAATEKSISWGLRPVWKKKSLCTPGTKTCVREKSISCTRDQNLCERKIHFHTRTQTCPREKSISTPVSERKIHFHTRDASLLVLNLAFQSDALPTELSPPRQQPFPLPSLRSFVFGCSLSKTPVSPSHFLLTCAAAVMGVLW